MAKARLSRDNRKLIIIIVLLIAFAAGFLIARTRYKPQIRETFNMVQEREQTINELREVIKSYENQIIQGTKKK
ncbi:MAG: hypothetical protein A3C30_04395 [Candidatus Levybacteria bacterium RIFCSPHIGHO2_02_FULL_40_18]|nr:MAG: hypothetical protein A2869_01725 [Candidatus Levybacteria bacterium RIFCSPHIGHO2_01_FULL_40_58]OGH26320.1 MAG: hypothetical protein A3C30_04395 [Candidatus Levybacteria bacterium RIFCSPHIGHO2_02_FULL_40_18]OGH31279.1 MAG: hypothetical protein A3E43_02650 [Candidatus Levybacteria bacterium RIFCSPHIGHO2_12_FULL_40_31]OGH40349.1 MAG: hypothetical protein A2894_05360 [Candidatus Levybacteria bacterium RIFCSPLOWO2_01_FULL_40_64]OGH49224.1 MAG: hypothetical protein A3I54_01080 [Candidatus Lev